MMKIVRLLSLVALVVGLMVHGVTAMSGGGRRGRERAPLGGLVGGNGQVIRSDGGFLLLPAAHLWNGSVPNAHGFPIENAISMRIMMAVFLLAIAFRKIHRCSRDAALVMGIMAEHLLRGARPTEEQVFWTFSLTRDAFHGLETMGIPQLRGYLPATHLPEEMREGLVRYFLDYIVNGVNMTTVFPNFIYANPWAESSQPAMVDNAAEAADTDGAVAGDDDDDDDDDTDDDDDDDDGSDEEGEDDDEEEEEDASHGPGEGYLMEFEEGDENDENAQ